MDRHLSDAASKYEDTQKDMDRFTAGIARLKQADLAAPESAHAALPHEDPE